MKHLVILIALFFSVQSFATQGWRTDTRPNTQTNNQSSKNENRNNNHNESSATAIGKGGAGGHGGKGGHGGSGGNVGDTSATGGAGGSVGDTSATGGSIGDTSATGGISSSHSNSSSETTLTDVGNASADVNDSGNATLISNDIRPINLSFPYAPEGLHLNENLFGAMTGIPQQIRGVQVVFVNSQMRMEVRKAMLQGTNLCADQSHGLRRFMTRIWKQHKQYLGPRLVVDHSIDYLNSEILEAAKVNHKYAMKKETLGMSKREARKYRRANRNNYKRPEMLSMIAEVTTAPHVRNSGNGAAGGDVSGSATRMLSGTLGQSATFGFAQVVMYCFEEPLDVKLTDVPEDLPKEIVDELVLKDLIVRPHFEPLVCGVSSPRNAILQRLLNKHVGTKLPGNEGYGTRTTAAVIKFQRAKGLPVHGKLVDRKTWNALND